MCRAEPIADAETIAVHLERIRALVSTWAAQVSRVVSAAIGHLLMFSVNLPLSFTHAKSMRARFPAMFR